MLYVEDPKARMSLKFQMHSLKQYKERERLVRSPALKKFVETGNIIMSEYLNATPPPPKKKNKQKKKRKNKTKQNKTKNKKTKQKTTIKNKQKTRKS